MLSKITGFVVIVFGVAMIFNFGNTLFTETQNAGAYVFILKSLLELAAGVFLLISGIEILKGSRRSQIFLIIGTSIIFIKSVLYFEIRNYMLLILIIFICMFRFLPNLKKLK
jgi:hypothetical protein